MSITATVIADASYCHRTNAGGWAAWVTVDGTPTIRIKRHGLFHARPKNSEEAERWACFNGVWLAYHEGNARFVLCQTDCLAVVRKNKENPGIEKLLSDCPGLVLQFRHVKGHTSTKDSRSHVNRWCDEHAKKHMRKQRG